jgi:hypothetical protein
LKYKDKKTHLIEKQDEWDLNKIDMNTAIYLQGPFQIYKYAESIKEIILSDFSFIKNIPDNIKNILKDMVESNSVAVHIRRCDYTGTHEYDICTLKYYFNASEYLKSQQANVKFFLFSDDVNWTDSHFSFLENYITVNTREKEYSDYYDLFLMTKAKHNIIANSSFSWWGAYLNKNMAKIVVCPSEWFRGKLANIVNIDDICPPEWIRMSLD